MILRRQRKNSTLPRKRPEHLRRRCRSQHRGSEKRRAASGNRLASIGLVILSLSATLVVHGQAPAPEASPPSPDVAPSAASPEADQPQKPPAKDVKTEKEKRQYKPVHFQSKGPARSDLKNDMHWLSGDVVFTQEDTKLFCDEATFNGKENTAQAKGHLRIVNDETTTITGDLVTADFDRELAVITGNIRLETQKKGEPKPDESKKDKEWRKKTILTCDKIEYYYGEGRAVATGNLKILHDKWTITGDEAVYLEKDEVATITGNVKAVDEEGRTIQCPKATVSTAEDWVELEGPISGRWWQKEEEQGTQPQTPSEARPPEQAQSSEETQPPSQTQGPSEAKTERPSAASTPEAPPANE